MINFVYDDMLSITRRFHYLLYCSQISERLFNNLHLMLKQFSPLPTRTAVISFRDIVLSNRIAKLCEHNSFTVAVMRYTS
jgi:hypothetical protein